ncbi:ornithine cyclodeaminase family protein [Streptomyces boninensis]|uniref:ornithine cyclodeaminase family protein n=1 Tax=Streptomyces boninensis TaxID=2039455 RepID=UPI003B21DB83
MTLILTRSTIRTLLADTLDAVEAAIAQAHRDLSDSKATLPTPPAMSLPATTATPDTDSATFLAMPAASTPARLATVKLLADLPANHAAGLPVQRSAVLAVDTTTGACLALLDGAELTRIRTAAATAVATRALARTDVTTLGLIGTGPLAYAHARALLPTRPYENVVLWGRTPTKAQTLATWITTEFGIPAKAVDHPRTVTEAADVLCTLTPSRDPIIKGAWLSPGQHINAVGAPPRPDHRELDTEAMVRSRIVIDAYDTARTKSGEILIPLAEGALTKDDFHHELGDVLTHRTRGRTHNDTDLTLFNSVGIGLQDLAITRLLIDLATHHGVGHDIDLAG